MASKLDNVISLTKRRGFVYPCGEIYGGTRAAWDYGPYGVERLPFRVRPHMLRATFVTLALEAGVPARDIMAATGHASVEMVAYYDRAFRSVGGYASHAVAGLVLGEAPE